MANLCLILPIRGAENPGAPTPLPKGATRIGTGAVLLAGATYSPQDIS